MTTISLVTPISYSKIQNLSLSEYILIYLSEDNKLKRAIPDFEGRFIDYDDSLILDALNAERVAPFKIVKRSKAKYETSPIFYISTKYNGEIVDYNNFGENITELENFLLDSKRRQTVSKLLKKNR